MKFWHFVIRRTLYVIPVLLGVCFVVFVLFNLVGGDPALTLLGKHASEEQILLVRKELGLDQSYLKQYLDIVHSAVTFDFGRSWNSKQDIWEMIKKGVPVSLSFTLPAFLISSFIAILFSLLVAYFRGTWIDKFFVGTSVALMSIPALAFILFSQTIFAYQLGWFEISGYDYGFPHFVPYVILPVIIWSILNLGPSLRFYRSVMLDEIYQDYVRTAYAKGLSGRKVLFKHVLKNGLIPIITFLVIQIPFLILGALLIENFFSIPGLGGIVLDAINQSDFPVIKAITILSAVVYILFNLLTDLCYGLIDPRVKPQNTQQSRGK